MHPVGDASVEYCLSVNKCGRTVGVGVGCVCTLLGSRISAVCGSLGIVGSHMPGKHLVVCLGVGVCCLRIV